jgi:hypothetical protein
MQGPQPAARPRTASGVCGCSGRVQEQQAESTPATGSDPADALRGQPSSVAELEAKLDRLLTDREASP